MPRCDETDAMLMVPCHRRFPLLLSWIALKTCLSIEGTVGFTESRRIPLTFARRINTQSSCLCMTQQIGGDKSLIVMNRRDLLSDTSVVALSLSSSSPAFSVDETAAASLLKEVTDPATYSALIYTPPQRKDNKPPPLLVVIHGAGTNERNVWNLADSQGEHAGLIPSLIASNKAPRVLLDNFAVLAPYSQGKRSFYEEPRQKLLQFIDWVCSDAGRQAGCPRVDTERIFLFGFSDGATETVELLTTGRFRGGIVASYGFTGTLPDRAIERLKGIPIWVFHSADDVIFPVECSDRLVAALRKNNKNEDAVRYSRFVKDQEGLMGPVQGHSTGITASKSPQVYEWMLTL